MTFSARLLLALLLLTLGLVGTGPAAASGGAVAARCDWARPGHDPFMGDVVRAVDRYTDIPSEVRLRLKTRMAQRAYDDLVSIRRDALVGQRPLERRYAPQITDMHFGAGSLCREVSRARWTDGMQERGLVYCDSGHCILVPTVCRNVSRIRLQPGPPPPAATVMDDQPLPPHAGGLVQGPLHFDPPAAGPSAVPDDEAVPMGSALPGSFVHAGGMPLGEDTEGRGLATLSDPQGERARIGRTPGRGDGGVGPPGGMGDGPGAGDGTAALRAPVSPVPEPQQPALLLLGLLALAAGLRRRRQLARLRRSSDAR